jgi:CHAD domain-containing protein
VKHCRYQLELLASLGVGLHPGCLRQLSSYQQRLGDLHDYELMLARLHKLAGRDRIKASLHRSLRRILLRRATRLRRACLPPPDAARPGSLLSD